MPLRRTLLGLPIALLVGCAATNSAPPEPLKRPIPPDTAHADLSFSIPEIPAESIRPSRPLRLRISTLEGDPNNVLIILPDQSEIGAAVGVTVNSGTEIVTSAGVLLHLEIDSETEAFTASPRFRITASSRVLIDELELRAGPVEAVSICRIAVGRGECDFEFVESPLLPASVSCAWDIKIERPGTTSGSRGQFSLTNPGPTVPRAEKR